MHERGNRESRQMGINRKEENKRRKIRGGTKENKSRRELKGEKDGK